VRKWWEESASLFQMVATILPITPQFVHLVAYATFLSSFKKKDFEL